MILWVKVKIWNRFNRILIAVQKNLWENKTELSYEILTIIYILL
jgi:hypothetical protein